MAGNKGNMVSVRVESTLPPADASWRVDVGDDPKFALLYTNLAYDLIAAAMAKLGVEISKYIVSGDEGAFKAEVEAVQKALRAGTV